MNKLYKITVLENGVEVLLRPVPPHVHVKIGKTVELSIPKPPAPPKTEWETADGRMEPVIAGPDSPEYKEWMEKREAWANQYGPELENLQYNISAALYDYRIAGWRFPTNRLWGWIRRKLNVGWIKFQPIGWELSKVGGVDVSTSIGVRADYIMTEIIQGATDFNTIQNVHREVEEVVTKREVEATASTFPSNGRAGGQPETVRGAAPNGDGGLRVDISRKPDAGSRDEGSDEPGNEPGSVV